MFERLKERVRQLKREVRALVLAARDPRTPWYAKWLVAGVVAYALSPIDLIPDGTSNTLILPQVSAYAVGAMPAASANTATPIPR